MSSVVTVQSIHAVFCQAYLMWSVATFLSIHAVSSTYLYFWFVFVFVHGVKCFLFNVLVLYFTKKQDNLAKMGTEASSTHISHPNRANCLKTPNSLLKLAYVKGTERMLTFWKVQQPVFRIQVSVWWGLVRSSEVLWNLVLYCLLYFEVRFGDDSGDYRWIPV